MNTIIWTKQKKKQLLRLYGHTDNEKLAAKLNVSASSLRTMACRMNIKKSARYWSKAAETFLLKNYALYSAIGLSIKIKELYGLDKPANLIYRKYQQLKKKENEAKPVISSSFRGYLNK